MLLCVVKVSGNFKELSVVVNDARDFKGVSLRVADLVFAEGGRVIAKDDV